MPRAINIQNHSLNVKGKITKEPSSFFVLHVDDRHQRYFVCQLEIIFKIERMTLVINE